MRIRCLLLTLLLQLLALNCFAQKLTFSGLNLEVIEENAPVSAGLSKIYVLPYITGVKASFESSSGNPVKWQRFSALGGGYAEDVASTQNGSISTLNVLEGNMGYLVTDGTSTTGFWVVDYSKYRATLSALTLSPQTDCATTWLDVSGSAEPIMCYGINGLPITLDRDFTLTYRTLEFDETEFTYSEITLTEHVAAIAEIIHCTPPLCTTEFTLTGDKFMRAWGEEASVTSPAYNPAAVEAHTRAVQTSRNVDNEIKNDSQLLGGSGPAEITFSAAVSDAAIYHEWEIALDPEFNQVYLRFSDLEFTHTFRDQGTSYVRLLIANDDATCSSESETYAVNIGESSLKCPNAFSPGASEGVNDEWRVSYKSIIEFDCYIFDRNGRKIIHLTDPSQGWNGKIRGKMAPAGVYFYVINALGADGKKYKLSGDINIIGYNKRAATPQSSTY